MKTSQNLSDYFVTEDFQSEDVLIGTTLFQFNKLTYLNEEYAFVFLGSDQIIYVANKDQFDAFLATNCPLSQLEVEIPKFFSKAEVQTISRIVPVAESSQTIQLLKARTDENPQIKTEAENLLEQNKTDILSAVKDFFANDQKEIDLDQLIEPAPVFKFNKKNTDGSSIEMEIPGGMTSKSYINGNIVVSMSTVNVYSDVLNGEGFSTTFVFHYQDRRFQELFFKQVIKSTSIGLALGFNFSTIVPKLPKIPTDIAEKGKATDPSKGNNEFEMNFSFAQQKFKQQMELRKDFYTLNRPVMMISTNLKTGERIVHNIPKEIEEAEKKQS